MPVIHVDIGAVVGTARRSTEATRCWCVWRSLRPTSLRARLVVIVLVIDVTAAALTGAVMVWKGRSATRLEITSAMQLSQSLASDAISLMQDAPAPILLQSIELQFQRARHVRIEVTDAEGHSAASGTDPEPPTSTTEEPPAWFLALVAPAIERKSFPVIVRGHDIGSVTVTSAPGDEVGEAWTYAHALIATGAALNVVVLVLLFLLFGRALAPLTALANGLRDLEDKRYVTRLPRPAIAELATIADHFNHTAEALAEAQRANSELHRKLLTAQDDERRRTALELHDEAGPCLFALEANATSIVTLTRDQHDLSRVHGRALDVVALVERVQSINRRVLDRLRPMALGRIPLGESLVKLLVDVDTEVGPRIDHAFERLRDSYGFLVDLTIYRCAQEGLLNAVRHAQASRVSLRVREARADDVVGLELCIEDDGRGLPDAVRSGLGLAGMRERVEALGGRFALASSSAGTRLDIFVPTEGFTFSVGGNVL